VFIKVLKGLFRRRETLEGDRREVPRWSEGRVHYDRAKCDKNYACVKHCPAVAISIREDKFIEIDHEKCIRCAVCTEVCPTKALTMKKE
jgi:Pyruvate/2-oxoacid:ferredoxin oxidoreductase delta subunit